jgi:hypothetical protein
LSNVWSNVTTIAFEATHVDGDRLQHAQKDSGHRSSNAVRNRTAVDLACWTRDGRGFEMFSAVRLSRSRASIAIGAAVTLSLVTATVARGATTHGVPEYGGWRL